MRRRRPSSNRSSAIWRRSASRTTSLRVRPSRRHRRSSSRWSLESRRMVTALMYDSVIHTRSPGQAEGDEPHAALRRRQRQPRPSRKGRQRSEQESLRQPDAQPLYHGQLRRRLDALHDEGHPRVSRELGDRSDELALDLIVVRAPGQLHVELDEIRLDLRHDAQAAYAEPTSSTATLKPERFNSCTACRKVGKSVMAARSVISNTTRRAKRRTNGPPVRAGSNTHEGLRLTNMSW